MLLMTIFLFNVYDYCLITSLVLSEKELADTFYILPDVYDVSRFFTATNN